MASLADNASSLRAFLGSIASIKGDLSNIAAPPFVLANQSTTQFPKYWAENPAIFCAPALEDQPEKRALLVLKWFLSALKQQQYAGRRPEDGVKKPLNAILGELFLAEWKDNRIPGTTKLVSEQVSHHPPVTACCLWNEECGIRAEGYTRQEITFTGSVNIQQIGHAILSLRKYDEDYLVPLPDVKVKGIIAASPYPELNGEYYITGSNGYVSRIDFSGKSLFRGKKNSFEAKVYKAGHETEVLYEAKGSWSDSFTLYDVKAGKELETYDVSAAKGPPIIVPARNQQDSWESQRVWGDVADAIERVQMTAVANSKSALEQAQRDMRKREEEEGKTFEPIFFRADKQDVRFNKLAKEVPGGEDIAVDQTNGVWKFDDDAYARAKRPFRSVTPMGVSVEQGTTSTTKQKAALPSKETPDSQEPSGMPRGVLGAAVATQEPVSNNGVSDVADRTRDVSNDGSVAEAKPAQDNVEFAAKVESGAAQTQTASPREGLTSASAEQNTQKDQDTNTISGMASAAVSQVTTAATQAKDSVVSIFSGAPPQQHKQPDEPVQKSVDRTPLTDAEEKKLLEAMMRNKYSTS